MLTVFYLSVRLMVGQPTEREDTKRLVPVLICSGKL